jgi:hypothetical protein
MGLSEEKRAQLLESTRNAATVLVEDVGCLREIVSKDFQCPIELRRVSFIVRRLLVDRDLSTIAAPRIGKIWLEAPGNNPIYRAGTSDPYLFFLSGGASIFGVFIKWGMTDRGTKPRTLKDADPSATTKLSFDGFCGQRVLCLNGQWVSRIAVVKYVANKCSAVHSQSPATEVDKTLSRLRSAATISLTEGVAQIAFNLRAIENEGAEFEYSKERIDAVLVELLATMHFLVNSPDVIRLEKIIQKAAAPR